MKFKRLVDGLKLLKLDTDGASKCYIVFKIYHVRNMFIKFFRCVCWVIAIMGMIIGCALSQYMDSFLLLASAMIPVLCVLVIEIICIDLKTVTVFLFYQSNVHLDIDFDYDFMCPVHSLSDVSLENTLEEYNKKATIKLKHKHGSKQDVNLLDKTLKFKLKEL